MAKKIKADNLAGEIADLLTKYNDQVSIECKKVVDEISQEVMDEVKNHISWHDKDYSKSFALKTSFQDKRNKRNTWYVKPPNYRLTHLLEFGHRTRRIKNGKAYTEKYPHVKYGDEYLKNNFFNRMKEAMEQCKI